MHEPPKAPSIPDDRASLVRRVGSIFYDSLLVLSLLFFATGVVLLFTGGRAIEPGNWLYLVYLMLVSFGYFGWSLTHGGQTLGMRAWRIKAVGTDGSPISWAQAAIRFGAALGGVGLLGMAFAPSRLPWQDRLSNSIVVSLPRR